METKEQEKGYRNQDVRQLEVQFEKEEKKNGLWRLGYGSAALSPTAKRSKCKIARSKNKEIR